MRKKKRPALASSNITKAWNTFFEDVEFFDPAELKKEGWMTNEEIAALSKLKFCAGRQIADFAAREGRLEKKAFKIMFGGKRRSLNFYRPK